MAALWEIPRSMDQPTVPAPSEPFPTTDATRTGADPSQPTVVPLSRPGTPGAPPPCDGRPFGRYRLVSELGRGGMGRVWKAWDPELARFVALKQVLGATDDEPEARARVERFRREAQLAARLRHPGIVAVHDVGEQDGAPYFTADYVEAEPLDAVISRSGAQGVPLRQAVLWVKAVAEALAYAHAQGVVHRDVKPGNILIDSQGQPHVTDFGLAKEVDLSGEGAATGSTLTMSGALVGTPQYMSPEQAAGRTREIGPAGDQFSLGVVLYELTAGRLPFRGESLRELLNAVTESEPGALRGGRADRDLETICLKALEKDPSRRYASMAELAADLGRWLDREPIRARPISGVARLAKWAARRRAVVIPAGLCALILAVGLPWWVSSRAERDREVEEASTRAALETAGRIQDVLLRWAALEEAIRRIEEVRFDESIPAEERLRRAEALWPPVQEFIDATPADPTSRATMLALAGWARRLAGRDEEGLSWMARASETAPDLPYGALMEAIVALEGYLALRPMPDSVTGTRKVTYVRPPAESPEMAERRTELETRIERAASARVWGEGTARDFQGALDAIRAVHSGRYADAEKGLTVALGRPPLRVFRTDLLRARAEVRAISGRSEEALADLQEVVRSRPRWTDGHLRIGYARYAIGDVPGALQAYDAALALDPRSVSALLNRGIARWTQGDDGMALADYDQVLSLDPGMREALVNRAVLHLRAGRPEAALGDAREATTRHTEDAVAWVALAQALAATGDRKGAIQADTTAIEKGPRLMEAWANRGAHRAAEGDHVAAIADFDQAIALHPSTSVLWRNRAGSHRAQGDLAAELKDLERGIVEAPTDAEAWRALGAARFERNDLAGAHAAYDESIRIDPSHSEGWLARAVVKFRRQLPVDAMQDFDEAVRLAPHDAATRIQRGVARFALGRHEDALADLDEAVRIDDAHPEAWEARARARHTMGLLEEAIEDYRAAIARMRGEGEAKARLEEALRAAEAENAARRPR